VGSYNTYPSMSPILGRPTLRFPCQGGKANVKAQELCQPVLRERECDSASPSKPDT